MRRILTAITGLFLMFSSGCGDCTAGGDDSTPSIDVDTVEQWLEKRAHTVGDADDLESIYDGADEAELVLLGEASHGTHDFYHWRSQITIAMAERQQLDFVAIEGDWYAARAADRYVMGKGDIDDVNRVVTDAFERWPQWMWANVEFAGLLRRLRKHNDDHPDRPVRVYGMDMQGFFESLDRLVEIVDSDAFDGADDIVADLECLREFRPEPQLYSRAIQSGTTRGCKQATASAVEAIRDRYDGDQIRHLSARKHARVVESGEAQYRTRVTEGGEAFWNVRASHMFDAVRALLDHHGHQARGVVWAHNTHIGDARATDMADRGRLNIGQLSRRQLGDDSVFAVGFSTGAGRVVAARRWGAPRRTLELPRPPTGSLDEKLSRHPEPAYLVVFEDGDDQLSFWADRPGQRAIGVVYHPDREPGGNYVPTNPAERYDALIYLDETSELNPF